MILLQLTDSFSAIFLFSLGHTRSVWKFPDQWWNLSCSCDLCHSCGNKGSLTHCARPGSNTCCHRDNVQSLTHYTTAGTPDFFFFNFNVKKCGLQLKYMELSLVHFGFESKPITLRLWIQVIVGAVPGVNGYSLHHCFLVLLQTEGSSLERTKLPYWSTSGSNGEPFFPDVSSKSSSMQV